MSSPLHSFDDAFVDQLSDALHDDAELVQLGGSSDVLIDDIISAFRQTLQLFRPSYNITTNPLHLISSSSAKEKDDGGAPAMLPPFIGPNVIDAEANMMSADASWGVAEGRYTGTSDDLLTALLPSAAAIDDAKTHSNKKKNISSQESKNNCVELRNVVLTCYHPTLLQSDDVKSGNNNKNATTPYSGAIVAEYEFNSCILTFVPPKSLC
eukprot:PhM_4_TR2429/c0_g1_i1/m.22289